MAPELWLLRHGDAEERSPSGSDADRRLTERGEQQARVVGAALSRLGLSFAAVYTSPKIRALDTARLACDALEGVEPIVAESLREGFSAADAIELLRGAGDERILAVGHNPDFAQVVRDLTGAQVPFKKGGVAGIAVYDRQLLALLRPHELRAIR